jgi:hypothetical protein
MLYYFFDSSTLIEYSVLPESPCILIHALYNSFPSVIVKEIFISV